MGVKEDFKKTHFWYGNGLKTERSSFQTSFGRNWTSKVGSS